MTERNTKLWLIATAMTALTMRLDHYLPTWALVILYILSAVSIVLFIYGAIISRRVK